VWWKRESIHVINNVGSTVSSVGPRISSLTSWLDSSAPPLVQTPDALDNSVWPFSKRICGGLHHPKSAPSHPHDECSQDSLLLLHSYVLMSMQLQLEEQKKTGWLGHEPRSGDSDHNCNCVVVRYVCLCKPHFYCIHIVMCMLNWVYSDFMLRQFPAWQSRHCSRFVLWALQREASTAQCYLHDCRT